MSEIFARYASEWLEQKLWPLALTTAGLPLDTSLETLLSMNLPKINADFLDYTNAEARTLSSQCLLFGSVMLAAELAQTVQARRIAHCIYGLMWKDAIEFAICRDLDMALEGIVSLEEGQRFDLAYNNWDRWRDTAPTVMALHTAFLDDCVEDMLWERRSAWEIEP